MNVCFLFMRLLYFYIIRILCFPFFTLLLFEDIFILFPHFTLSHLNNWLFFNRFNLFYFLLINLLINFLSMTCFFRRFEAKEIIQIIFFLNLRLFNLFFLFFFNLNMLLFHLIVICMFHFLMNIIFLFLFFVFLLCYMIGILRRKTEKTILALILIIMTSLICLVIMMLVVIGIWICKIPTFILNFFLMSISFNFLLMIILIVLFFFIFFFFFLFILFVYHLILKMLLLSVLLGYLMRGWSIWSWHWLIIFIEVFCHLPIIFLDSIFFVWITTRSISKHLFKTNISFLSLSILFDRIHYFNCVFLELPRLIWCQKLIKTEPRWLTLLILCCFLKMLVKLDCLWENTDCWRGTNMLMDLTFLELYDGRAVLVLILYYLEMLYFMRSYTCKLSFSLFKLFL